VEFAAIWGAVRRNRVGVFLVVLQTAITVAILCNGIFIAQQRVAFGSRLTGADEHNVFVLKNQWDGTPADLEARVRTDLVALRSLPGVLDASVSNSFPLSNSGSTGSVSLKPDQAYRTAGAAIYRADDHTIGSLGLKLVAGRNFLPSDIVTLGPRDSKIPSNIIITRALATRLFPNENAAGKAVYLEAETSSTTIVGVVDALQVPWSHAGGWGSYYENSILEPILFISRSSYYVVCAKPGEVSRAMREAIDKLTVISRARVLTKITTLTDAKAVAYRSDRGIAVLLTFVALALSAVTACGLFTLTSYWVAQRRRQIGIRRALGATKLRILLYFQAESLLIALVGAAIGMLLAVALSRWLSVNFETTTLKLSFVIAGGAIVLVLGQMAVLLPALRAASVPPALAIRAF
jgi:putative ABC transport system permease protein